MASIKKRCSREPKWHPSDSETTHLELSLLVKKSYKYAALRLCYFFNYFSCAVPEEAKPASTRVPVQPLSLSRQPSIRIFVKSFKDIKRHYTFERLVNELKRLQLVL